MKKRRIGPTDLEASSLGLGTVKFGRNQQVKYPQGFELPSDEEIRNILDVAQSEGINLLDTAPAYGTSEERLGEILDAQSREEWVIASKAGEEFVDGASRFDFSKSAITASVERSLRRLKTDRLEVVLLHSDGEDVDILQNSGAPEALAELKEAGKILATGISTKTVAGGCMALDLGMDVVMATYHPWHQNERAILDRAGETGAAIFLKKALGSGWFGSERAKDQDSEALNPIEHSLRFIFEHPASTSVIIGSINPSHIIENSQTMRAIESSP